MDSDLPGYRLETPLADDRGSGGPGRSGGGPPPSGTAGDPPFGLAGSDGNDRPPARVWRAVRLADGVAVAIKVFASEQAGLARREAALLAAVDHPHVLALLDVVAGDDHIGLVTELAAGGSLRAVLGRRGRLTWQESLTVLIPLADALYAADERGLVHGDLSTGNVLFDEVGRPLLADLGAARAAAEMSAPVAVTPTDVAPEVARGAVPDHRSDLFSLGSIALQCLSGRPAWPADTLTDVLIQSTAGQWPDPDDAIAPEQLLDILRRLLDPDPRRRGSAAAAAVDLRRVGEPAPVDLAGLGEDGLPRVAATVVRPEVAAQRRADLEVSGAPRRGHRRASGSRASGRASGSRAPGRASGRASGRAPGSASDSAFGGQERGAPVDGPHRRAGTHRRGDDGSGGRAWFDRVRGVAFVIVVVLALGAGAVRVGLWWAGSGRVDPAALTASPPTESRNGGAADSMDWTAVVIGLDALRARALTARDPALLDLVYTRDSPARSADAGTISGLVAAGYRLADARHDIGTVTRLPDERATAATRPPPDVTATRTALAVVESMPAIDVSDAAGLPVGHTGPSAPATVVLVVVGTDRGFRISSIRPG